MFSLWCLPEVCLMTEVKVPFVGEGNGNPLQCSCLENPRASRAWWAVIYGVAQSQTWLKQLSSSSSGPLCHSLVAQTVKRLPTMQETRVQSLGQEDLLEKEIATHSVFLPGKPHRQWSLVGYSPWNRKESDMTERFHFHFQAPLEKSG